MKTVYKIFFSMCSTLVCVIYSVRSFAAVCTTVTSAGGNVHSYVGGNTGCAAGYLTSYYKYDGTTGLMAVYTCKGGCADSQYYTGYTTTLRPTANSSCTLTYGNCNPCPSLGGAAGSGAGGSSGIAACYMPANRSMKDANGSIYVFDKNCYYAS